MKLTPTPAIVYDNLMSASWVRTAARNLSDSNEDRNLALDISKIMAEFREKYGWAAASVQNILFPELDQPVNIIQVDKQENPHGQNSETWVNVQPNPNSKAIHTDPSGDSCGSLVNPFFWVARPANHTFMGIPLEDYLAGCNTPSIVRVYGPYYSRLAEHERDHTNGNLVSDFGPICHLYAPYGKYIPEMDPETHFPSILGDMFYTLGSQIKFGYGDPQFEFVQDGRITKLKHIDSSKNNSASLIMTLTPINNELNWVLHTEYCSRKPSSLPYGKPIIFAFPNDPDIKETLISGYPKYQSTLPPEPMFRPELILCDCMVN